MIPSGTAYSKIFATYGETVTAGQVLYLKSTDSLYWKAQCDGTAEEATIAGVALVGGGAGQVGVLLTGGTVTIGGTVVAGTSYVVSTTAGGIAPFADLISTNKVSYLGIATTTAIINVSINNTGITKA